MYGQIISFLFVILIIYYVVMILLDLQKAKDAKAAELEKDNEEEIDISDEANTFKPVLITRDDPNKTSIQETSDDSNEEENKETEKKEDKENTEANKDSMPSEERTPSKGTSISQEPIVSKDIEPLQDAKTSPENEEESPQPLHNDKPFHREGYREPSMTGFLDIDDLLEQVDHLAETGTGPLAQVIHDCQSAHF